MKRLIELFRSSFSARLSLWVAVFATIIFLCSQLFASSIARRSVREEAIAGATRVLENTELRLTRILDDVETVADNIEWLAYRHLDSPDTLLEYTRVALQGNQNLLGCSISFEPYFFEGQQYFSAYSSNVDGVVTTKQEGSENYQYFYLDWYLLPKILNQPGWTEPYADWDSDDDKSLQTDMMVSYCKPLTSADGTFIGAISMDLSLKWLSENISRLKPYADSYCTLISRGGTYMVHPDPDKLFYKTVFTNSLLEPDQVMTDLGHSMQDWNEGFQEVIVDGVDSFVFYKPLKNTGWSLAIVCPEKSIFGAFDRLKRIVLALLILGMLLMFATCTRVVGRMVKPLSALTTEAGRIAAGDFEYRLPLEDRPDEIGALSRSFDNMQTSLVSYIEELKITTANRERIQGDLRVAHNIQMAMVPNEFPPFPDRSDLDIYASMTPAREVGGDLYDYFINGDKLYFCIGDVSGKGIPASIVMAITRVIFRVYAKQNMSPVEIACHINDNLSEDNETMMFVTAFIGMIDLSTGSMDYCNCGHNRPVIVRVSAAPAYFDCEANTVIGVCPGWQYKGQHVPDVRGRMLFLYTDGLSEAENSSHELFGEDRLLEVVTRNRGEGAEEMVKSMMEAVSAHVAGAEASDDMTMLCIELRRI
jgi:sigma-B regulation protein RsbU (phosphoserine phosphatase)